MFLDFREIISVKFGLTNGVVFNSGVLHIRYVKILPTIVSKNVITLLISPL